MGCSCSGCLSSCCISACGLAKKRDGDFSGDMHVLQLLSSVNRQCILMMQLNVLKLFPLSSSHMLVAAYQEDAAGGQCKAALSVLAADDCSQS